MFLVRRLFATTPPPPPVNIYIILSPPFCGSMRHAQSIDASIVPTMQGNKKKKITQKTLFYVIRVGLAATPCWIRRAAQRGQVDAVQRRDALRETQRGGQLPLLHDRSALGARGGSRQALGRARPRRGVQARTAIFPLSKRTISLIFFYFHFFISPRATFSIDVP
jgi:hypothetical protein